MSRANTVIRALPGLALIAMAGCATTGAAEPLSAEEQAYQDAISQALVPATPEEIAQAERSDPITRANFWANEYQKNAADLETTIAFMRALRRIGSHDRVVEVATTALPIHPQSYELYLELGRSFLSANKPTEAAQAFVRSADFAPETEAAPLAGLGLAFDRLENHAQAQDAYEIALQREPDRVSTLSNYGLSLALTGQLNQAEAALRKAAEQPGADVRVRQNLALILGLQGRFDEMAAVDPSAPTRSVEANQTVLRQMVMPTRNYDSLQNLDEVISDLERTPGASEAMPDLNEANVQSEAMAEPDGAEIAGAADGAPVVSLRPKLRGTQGD
ncbi:MAG: hypothetical protein NXH78_01230 [Hyphomonadaceae bacterium]|nr:hypothetical protein [Hyphomonadaceae bacterium]